MRALIVCADAETSCRIRDILKPGVKCDIASSAKAAFNNARSVRYGLYFLDIGIAGAEVCRAIREFSDDPVIFISTAYNEAEAVACFDAGGDDYLSRPFGELELCSRVRAIMRRCEGRDRSSVKWLDAKSHTASIDGETVHLTPMEFDILSVLATAHGRVVPKSTLIRDVWGIDSYATDDALKVRVNALRSKIGRDKIETVRGYGYRLVSET